MDKLTQKKIEDTKFLLEASEELIVLQGLEKLEKFSHPSLVESLLKAYAYNHSAEINKKIIDLFNNIVDVKAADELLKLIEKQNNLGDRRAPILASFWQNRHNSAPYLVNFVNIALTGTYLDAIEALTVIENMDPPIADENIMESILLINNAMELPTLGKDKETIVKLILKVIQGFQEIDAY